MVTIIGKGKLKKPQKCQGCLLWIEAKRTAIKVSSSYKGHGFKVYFHTMKCVKAYEDRRKA